MTDLMEYYSIIKAQYFKNSENTTFINEEKPGTISDILSNSSRRMQIVAPEVFFINRVHNLPNIEAVVRHVFHDYSHFITVLSYRDIEVRDKLYNIELEMFEEFPDCRFYFTVSWLSDNNNLITFIKNKEVLFYKSLINAKQERTLKIYYT